LRPPTLDDVSATVSMLNASSLATLGTPGITEEEFRADWQEPGFNLTTDSRVVTSPDGQLVGMMDAVMQPPYVRNFIWGRVHPQHCRLGIGTVLTTWKELRLIWNPCG